MSWTCIPYTYLQVQGEESLQIDCSDISQLQPVKSKSIPERFCYKGNLTEFYRCFPFGTTLQRSEVTTLNVPMPSVCGKEYQGNSPFVAGSRNDPARTFQPLEKAQESPANDQAFGLSLPASLARYDRDTSSWKIHPCLFPEDSMSCSVTLPKWGTMRNGELSERGKSAHLTSEIEYGYWPTPRVCDTEGGVTKAQNDGTGWYRTNKQGTRWGVKLKDAVASAERMMWPTPDTCQGGTGPSQANRHQPRLQDAVKQWATPSSRDHKGHTITKNHPDGFNVNLCNQVALYPTPSENEDAAGQPGKKMQRMLGNCEEVRNSGAGTLNPTWVELLMGWPANWTALDEPCTGEIVGWGDGWEGGVPRVTTKSKHRTNRLKAIGNGQVPAAAATAWEILCTNSKTSTT